MLGTCIRDLIAQYDETLQQKIQEIIHDRFSACTLSIDMVASVVQEVNATISEIDGHPTWILIDENALGAVADYFRPGGITLEELVERVKEDFGIDYGGGSSGAAALLLVGEDAIPTLRGLLASPDLYCRENAAWALSFIGGRETVRDFVDLFFSIPMVIENRPPKSYGKAMYLADIFRRGLGVAPLDFLERALFSGEPPLEARARNVVQFLEDDYVDNEHHYPEIAYGVERGTPAFKAFLEKLQAKGAAPVRRRPRKRKEETL